MKIIGLLAEKGCGKDTVADHLIENYGFTRASFAEPMKRACMHLFDFSEEQVFGTQVQKEAIDPRWGVSPREVLQVMGTEMFQYDIHKYLPNLKVPERNFWVERFDKWYSANDGESKKIVFSDVRFKHEIDKIHEMGGEVWKIVRPNVGGDDQHGSEAELRKINDYDWLINNNSTLSYLYELVDERIRVYQST